MILLPLVCVGSLLFTTGWHSDVVELKKTSITIERHKVTSEFRYAHIVGSFTPYISAGIGRMTTRAHGTIPIGVVSGTDKTSILIRLFLGDIVTAKYTIVQDGTLTGKGTVGTLWTGFKNPLDSVEMEYSYLWPLTQGNISIDALELHVGRGYVGVSNAQEVFPTSLSTTLKEHIVRIVYEKSVAEKLWLNVGLHIITTEFYIKADIEIPIVEEKFGIKNSFQDTTLFYELGATYQFLPWLKMRVSGGILDTKGLYVSQSLVQVITNF